VADDVGHHSRPAEAPEASRPASGGVEPARSGGIRPAYVFGAYSALLLIVGAFLMVMGIHDAVFAHANAGVSAGAFILAVVGVVVVVAGCQLARQSPGGTQRVPLNLRYDAGMLVVVAFLLTTFVCIYIFLAAGGAAETQRLLVYLINLAVFVLSVLGLILFGRDVNVTVRNVGAAVALGVIGIAVGAFEFWYQNQYLPAHAGRAVALTASLRVVAQQNTYSVVRATLTYQDIGGRAVRVIGSTYTLTGSRVVRCLRPTPSAKTIRQLFEGFLVDPQRSRYTADVWEEHPAALLGAGKFVGDGKRLDPHVPGGRDLLFYVPRHRFQLLRLRAQLFALPASVQLSRNTLPKYATFPGDNELYGFWQITNDSWLRDLINGRRRWVVIRYELVRPDHKDETTPSPDFRVTARFPSPTWNEALPNAAVVDRLFNDPTQPADSSEPFADTELPLEAVAKPAPLELIPRCQHGS
jgi:hypothetical protein